MFKFSTARWTGPGKTGTGKITSGSNLLKEIPYTFDSRFSSDVFGTNPEELLAAAHASCFAMKLGFILDEAGHSAKSLRVTAKVEFANGTISSSHLEVWAQVPDISRESFLESIQETERCCPVSRALRIRITCTTNLDI